MFAKSVLWEYELLVSPIKPAVRVSPVKIICPILSAGDVIGSVFLINNTVTIGISIRKEEINIMKYVGATDWFIRWPFIIEGIIIGVVGALVPLIIGFPVYASVTSAIFSYLPMITFVQFRLTGDVFGFLIPFGIIFGIALGGIGSVTSIRKHLRV